MLSKLNRTKKSVRKLFLQKHLGRSSSVGMNLGYEEVEQKSRKEQCYRMEDFTNQNSASNVQNVKMNSLMAQLQSLQLGYSQSSSLNLASLIMATVSDTTLSVLDVNGWINECCGLSRQVMDYSACLILQ